MQTIERIEIRASGLDLVADAQGNPAAAPILFLHGGGQTRQSWGSALQEAATRGYRAVSLDQRGHGDSAWASDGNYSLQRFAADLREVVHQIGGVPVLVGASLGGLVGLTIAGSPPPAVRALVLVDITPRIEEAGSKEIGAFMNSAPDGFASVDEAADAVATYLPHRPRPQDVSGLRRNLRLRGGRYFWHWDPALMATRVNEVAQINASLQAAARAIEVPTLLIRGAHSRIVSDAGVREFLQLVPHARFAEIADAHHMVAGDSNDAFNDAVFGFIAELG